MILAHKCTCQDDGNSAIIIHGPGCPRRHETYTAGTMVISGTGSIPEYGVLTYRPPTQPECGVLTYKAPTQDSERAALLQAEVHRLRQQVIALTCERDAALREVEKMREREPAYLPLRKKP